MLRVERKVGKSENERTELLLLERSPRIDQIQGEGGLASWNIALRRSKKRSAVQTRIVSVVCHVANRQAAAADTNDSKVGSSRAAGSTFFANNRMLFSAWP
jgi:hypothetical protein